MASPQFYYHNLSAQGSYEDYIAADEEVKQLLTDINQVVSDNGEDCKVKPNQIDLEETKYKFTFYDFYLFSTPSMYCK